MKLNPKECTEMYINFMTTSVTSLRPICVGYKEVERVGAYKLLGVIVSDDFKWNIACTSPRPLCPCAFSGSHITS